MWNLPNGVSLIKCLYDWVFWSQSQKQNKTEQTKVQVVSREEQSTWPKKHPQNSWTETLCRFWFHICCKLMKILEVFAFLNVFITWCNKVSFYEKEPQSTSVPLKFPIRGSYWSTSYLCGPGCGGEILQCRLSSTSICRAYLPCLSSGSLYESLTHFAC